MRHIRFLVAAAVMVSFASVAAGQARAPRLPVTPKLAPAPKLAQNPELAPTPGLEVRSRNGGEHGHAQKTEPAVHRRRHGRERTVFYDPYYDVIVPVAPLPPAATGTSPNAGTTGSTSNGYSVPTYQVPTYTIPKYP